MSFENSRKTYTMEQIADMVKNGVMLLNNPIQRGFVWTNANSSLLIHSIIIGIPIPDFFVETKKIGKKICYDVLDGKQRSTTIYKFLNNMFKLSNDIPDVTFLNDSTGQEEIEEIKNKKFSELSSGLQKKIKSANIEFIKFGHLEGYERNELFSRYNNGKVLTLKNKAASNAKDLATIMELSNCNLFKERKDGGMVTRIGMENKSYIPLIAKAHMVMFGDMSQINFKAKFFTLYLRNMKIKDEERSLMEKSFNYLYDVHEQLLKYKDTVPVAKKIYMETHYSAIIPFVKKAIENEIIVENFSEWLVSFYSIDNGASISEKYNISCMQGVASNSNIITRYDELSQSFEAFFELKES